MPEASARTVRYARGRILERYDNTESGLSLHLTIRDAGSDQTGELVYSLSTGLRAVAAADGGAIGFYAGPVRLMRLAVQPVAAAAGSAPPVTLDLSGGKLHVRWTAASDDAVEVALLLTGPSESLTSPPLQPTPAWTAESNQDSAQFGFNVATAGDVNGDGFDDVLVSAPFYDNGQTDEGRVWCFLGSSTGLSTTAAWTAEGDQAGAHFGWAVESAGDVNGDGYADILVGADAYDNGQIDEGGAFLYLGSASGLSATPAWKAESNQAGTRFGHSVGTAGDVDGDGYDDIVVTGPNYDNGQLDEGRVFLYKGSPSGPSVAPTWTFETNQSSAFMNQAHTAGDVNGDGYDDLIVAADHAGLIGSNTGRVYLFLGSATGLAATPVWTAEGSQSGAQFGFAAGTAGDVNADGYSDVIVVSDSFSNGQSHEGAAFVWLGGPQGRIMRGITGSTSNADWSAESNQSDAFLRWGGTAGDVDGDGYGDVIVGAGWYATTQPEEGRAMVFLGSPSGLQTTPAWIMNGGQAFARFASYVSTAGDVNGDGASDVIVGAYLYSNGQSAEGRAFLYLAGSSACTDRDHDGFGSPGSSACSGGSETDCNDDDPNVHPGAVELCDSVDNNCDGTVDEGFVLGAVCSVGTGACTATGVTICAPGGAGTTCSAVPGTPAPEVCDGLDNDCDGLVDENAIKVGATGDISPTTLNVNSQGTSFTVSLTLMNVCDPAHLVPIDGTMLDRAFISRAGGSVLPDPASLVCPAPNGDVLFERGISDNILARNVTNNAVSLKFNLASDGDCRTLDGDRQDLLALMTDVLDNAIAQVCVTSSVAGSPFEVCLPVAVKNRGNR